MGHLAIFFNTFLSAINFKSLNFCSAFVHTPYVCKINYLFFSDSLDKIFSLLGKSKGKPISITVTKVSRTPRLNKNVSKRNTVIISFGKFAWVCWQKKLAQKY